MKIHELRKYRIIPLMYQIRCVDRGKKSGDIRFQLWYKLSNDFFPVLLQRGMIKDYVSLDTLYKDFSSFADFESIPVFFIDTLSEVKS